LAGIVIVELLVPLTWPLEKNEQMTVNHHRHMPHLQEAQISYKRGILNHEEGRLLRTVVRIALPSMALPIEDRSHRDNGIIKLVLYLMRNIAAIAPGAVPQGVEDDHEVSRSATVEAFHYQDIFHLLLTISSSMGEDFDVEDVVILETLFHLLKGVDAERLLLPETQLDTRKADELRNLLHKEAGMLRSYAKDAPTRHNRFGTMIWIKRGDDRVASVSGQDVLMDPSRGLAKMDETKKWKKPRGKRKEAESAQVSADRCPPSLGSAKICLI
jgi:replication fork protection complex subunit Tof1/Swi1